MSTGTAVISTRRLVKPGRNSRYLIFLTRSAAVLASLLGAAPSCGLIFPRHRETQKEPSGSSRVSVEVQSHNWNDITVYLMAGGLPQRLGMVTALGEATFDFPAQRLNTSAGVRLRALPVAGQPFTSETILVLPGQAIYWTLENNLDASSYSVY
jgi:hypothetical protein